MQSVNSSTDLAPRIERLRREIRDFEVRTSRHKAALDREGRYVPSDPLYQRLASIRDYLRSELRATQEKLDRRTRKDGHDTTT